MKLLCITPIKHIRNAWKSLSSCGEVIYEPNASLQTTQELIVQEKVKILFVNPNEMSFRLTSEVLRYGIEIICTASTGLNHIDMNYCKNHGIQVISLTKNYDIIQKISSTAELAFALTLSLVRNIPSAFDSVKRREWEYRDYIGRQMDSLSAGVVGYGRLGTMYAGYCKAFGMSVSVCDPYKPSGRYPNLKLEELFPCSDIVSLHVHLNNQTRYLVNQKVLSKSHDVYLINTSRGDIVDESAIISALETGNLKGYAADVLSDELGNIEASPMIEASRNLNIILTPHIGGMTAEAQEIAYNGVIGQLSERAEKL